MAGTRGRPATLLTTLKLGEWTAVTDAHQLDEDLLTAECPFPGVSAAHVWGLFGSSSSITRSESPTGGRSRPSSSGSHAPSTRSAGSLRPRADGAGRPPS